MINVRCLTTYDHTMTSHFWTEQVNFTVNLCFRHLLSDQSDPFNRSPLSMDQVKSNTELKERIHAWIAEQREKMAQTTVE